MRGVQVMALVAAAAAGCVPGDIDLTGRRCPCVAGWMCGPDDVCVRIDAAAPPMDARPLDAPPGDAARPDGSDGAVPPIDTGPPDAPAPIDAPVGPDPPWWDLAWGSRARIRVSNGAAGPAPAGLQVALAIDLAMLRGATRRSLRTLRWDDGARAWTELARSIDDPTAGGSDSRIWFALQAPVAAGAPDGSYWLYWDAPAADDDDRPDEVFDFHDGFDGTTLASDWARQDPVRVAGGEVELSAGASIRSTSVRVGPGQAVDFALRAPGFAGSSYYWTGLQRESDFDDAQPWMIWINRSSDPDHVWAELQVDDVGATGSGSHLAMDGAVHRYSVEREGDRVAFVRDGVEVSLLALGATYMTPLQIRIRTSTGGPTMYVDWARIRTVLRPAPAVTLDAPEPRP